MFNADSMLVKTWVRLVKAGAFTKEQVPDLSNLRDIVLAQLGAD